MTEIKKLDDKYLVLKKDDLDNYFAQFTKGIFTTDKEKRLINQLPFNTVLEAIKEERERQGKKDNRYLVLNLDDEIAELYLEDAIDRAHKKAFELSRDTHTLFVPLKVKDIAVDLVNASLKAKEKS